MYRTAKRNSPVALRRMAINYNMKHTIANITDHAATAFVDDSALLGIDAESEE